MVYPLKPDIFRYLSLSYLRRSYYDRDIRETGKGDAYMKQEVLARTIIETMLNKALRDIERDPDRSIRNLIDLGINFAKGRFQQ